MDKKIIAIDKKMYLPTTPKLPKKRLEGKLRSKFTVFVMLSDRHRAIEMRFYRRIFGVTRLTK